MKPTYDELAHAVAQSQHGASGLCCQLREHERARAETWKQLAQDAANVLNAFAVGRNTQEAIERAETLEGQARVIPSISQRDRAVYRVAMTLAHNICVDESNRVNADDGPLDVVHALSAVAGVMRKLLEPSEADLLQMLAEADLLAMLADGNTLDTATERSSKCISRFNEMRPVSPWSMRP